MPMLAVQMRASALAAPPKGVSSRRGSASLACPPPRAVLRRGRAFRRRGVVCVAQPDAQGGVQQLERAALQDLAEPSTAGELRQQRAVLATTRQSLADAIREEKYEEAAELHQRVGVLERNDPILRRRQRLAQCIADEIYQEAAVLRDELAVLEDQLMPKIPCESDTVTEDVRVHVRSVFVPDRSDASQEYYFFAYQVKILNMSDQPVQLLSRHWTIADKNGKVETVSGPGVVGDQPIINPGEAFEYTSACPLHTHCGTMEGSYSMVVVHDDPVNQREFDIEVGRFGLDEFNRDVPLPPLDGGFVVEESGRPAKKSH